jgi:PIN domain nuclease of toxin-antitoxin system
VSPQERIIIADTVKHLLFAASLDRYLMQLNKRKVHGVVSERHGLALTYGII